MKRFFLLFLIFFSAIYSQAQETFILDPTFGQNGLVQLPANDLVGSKTLSLPDGKLLVYCNRWQNGLYYEGAHYLVRLNSDGTLDSGFGNGGEQAIPTDLSFFFSAISASVLSDGAILLGADGYGVDTFRRVSLTRCMPDGKVDSTFGINGVCTIEDRTPDRQFDLRLRRVIVSPGGKIFLFVGWADVNATEPPFGQDRIYCVLPSGQIDSTFGTNGHYTLVDTLSFYFAPAIMDADENLYLFADDYDPNVGSLSLRFIKFDPQMNVILNVDLTSMFASYYLSYSSLPIVQPDGKIILNLESYPGGIIARLLPDGTLDPAFNKIGYYSGNFYSGSGGFRYVSMLSDGKLIGLGNYNKLIFRLNKNGTPDLLLGLTGSNNIYPSSIGSAYVNFGFSMVNESTAVRSEEIDHEVYISRYVDKKCH